MIDSVVAEKEIKKFFSNSGVDVTAVKISRCFKEKKKFKIKVKTKRHSFTFYGRILPYGRIPIFEITIYNRELIYPYKEFIRFYMDNMAPQKIVIQKGMQDQIINIDKSVSLERRISIVYYNPFFPRIRYSNSILFKSKILNLNKMVRNYNILDDTGRENIKYFNDF